MKAPAKPTKPRTAEEKEKLSTLVLEGMKSGLSALKACEKAGVNQSTFTGWLNDDPKLAKEYARAREILIEKMASELLEIADKEVPYTDDGKKDWQAVQKHKLQVDTRKWLLSKLAPKKYGDKLEVSGDAANPIAIQRIERVIVK